MISLAAACCLMAACTAAPVSDPMADSTTIPTGSDYAAMQETIEDRIASGSLNLSTIDAVLISVGIAIDEKIISGLDATLPELLPRYRKYLSAEEKSITLRQLMSMTAGFPPDDPAPFENIHRVFELRTDPIPMILTDGLA